MRILLVSWFFPRSNTIGALRLGGLARYLHERGHEVRVIAPRDPPYSQTLDLQVPAELITHTRWYNVNALPEALARLLRRSVAPGSASAPAGASSATSAGASPAPPGLVARLKRMAGQVYVSLFNWPDRWVGWLPPAIGAGRQLLRAWTPDLIFASGPPFTALLIGYVLSRSCGAPLVLEFRDRWWDDPYYPPPRWLGAINRAVERRLVKAAIGLTTVSEPWAATYRARYGKPVAVIYNGYDADRITAAEAAPPEQDASADGRLTIVYTGSIYPGRRDPSPLFEAISLLGEAGRSVRVVFYGTDPQHVYPLGLRYGLDDVIEVHPEIPQERVIAVQRAADVLLLMQWNDPREQGNVPGKFFEYLGVLRPILILGLGDGVPATLGRERGVGLHGADAKEIAGHLSNWLEIKHSRGSIPGPAEAARVGFARQEQYRALESFLASLLDEERRGGK